MSTITIEIIRTDGRREQHDVGKHIVFPWLERMLGARMFDTVNLRDGCVMLVDDTGLTDGKPVNPEATKLYHSVCLPGTTNPICGAVAVAIDADFR